MAMCLRNLSSSEDEDALEGGRGDEEEEESSPISDSPFFSVSSPGDSDVFLQESAFGSFTSYGEPGSVAFPATPSYMSSKQSSSSSVKSRSSQRSSSSDSSASTTKQGTMTKLFRRSVSLIVRSRSGVELSSMESFEFTSPLSQIKDSLLHIYRTNTLPHQGLCRFHEMLAELVFSGGGGCFERWWKEEVVPTGTRMLAVMVACPKDGDQIEALLNSWHLLYRKTLPLLQAAMVPLNTINVRKDVLEAFRDSVLPYSGIKTALKSEARMMKERRWKLKQMILILARLGPCQCRLTRREERRSQDENKVADFSLGSSSPLEPVPEVAPSSTISDLGPSLPSPWNAPRINELVYLLMDERGDERTEISSSQLEEILHLHHGQGDNFQFNIKLSSLQRQERLPSPGHWLTRNPTSVHSLEELLRSAASR
ncbi:uncharacterized protein LOC135200919 [Macrobrachium nipponense]|uniref:uncharacterized protein LOC135200919 n=1 Tax=Macrobrachium nipponense TaxID=159736 RepID=UPI0030C8481E